MIWTAHMSTQCALMFLKQQMATAGKETVWNLHDVSLLKTSISGQTVPSERVLKDSNFQILNT